MNPLNNQTFAPIRKLNNKYVCNFHYIIPTNEGVYMISKKLNSKQIIFCTSNLMSAQFYCNIYLN